MPVSYSTVSGDAGKYIQDALIERSQLAHRLPQMCEMVSLPTSMGLTANFTKFNRTNVPVDKLVEGQTPSETAMTITTQTVTVEQWGLYIALTDIGVVTTKHPVLNEALDLVSDAIARTQDYNIAEVLNAGTNTQFWDGTRAARSNITTSDVFKAAVVNKARVAMNDNGSPPRDGDLFVAVIGPQVEGDILAETASVGSFSAAHQNAGNEKLEKGTVGTWLGVRWVRSNFVPKFTRLSTSGWTFSFSNTASGAMAGTCYYKVTRKNLTRGFEEDISVEANSGALGANDTATFTAPATSGYVYNIYIGSSTGDANLFLAVENAVAGSVNVIYSQPTSGTNPPTTPASGVTVHPVYLFAAKALDCVELGAMSMKGMITPKGSSDSDPLDQRRKTGAKYMQKAGIRDQLRHLRIELASNF